MYYNKINYKKRKKNTKNFFIIFSLTVLILILIYFIVSYYFNFYSKIKKLIDEKKFLKAENLIEKKIKKEKFNPILFYYYGYLYFNKKDFFNSLLFFKKALFFINEYNNIPFDVYYYIGFSYYYLGKDYYYYSYKYLNYYFENIKIKKIDPELYFILGILEINIENYKGAYNHLSKIYKDYKSNFNYLYYFSISQKNAGYLNEAIENLKFIINKSNDIDLIKSSFYLLGKIYFELKDYNESQHFFSKVLELNPTSSDTYYYLALIEYNKKNYADAKSLILKSLLINPNNKDSIELLKKLK
ncbi:MAG: tetratricopeptide repeat protein [Spirochaetes bacterium]|nr:tetratricopeptide repeat protein [Spirochaetota bacterium]